MDTNKSFVKVQLKDGQMVELYTAYDRLSNTYAINSKHDLLMLAHIAAFRTRLRRMISKCAQRCTLKMEGPELLAFMQLWERGNPEMNDCLRRIIEKILLSPQRPVPREEVARSGFSFKDAHF